MSPEELRELLTDSHVTECAKRLLGCEIVAPDCGIRIVEAEAYGGEEDPNSHAYHGVTERNRVMFETTGCAYVYLNYGVHWLFNVTCRPAGTPGAVLIRGAMPVEGRESIEARRLKAKSEHDLLSGPGKIGAAIAASREHSGIDLLDERSRFTIAPGEPTKRILEGPRVGLREGSDKREWRFIDEENREWASSPRL